MEICLKALEVAFSALLQVHRADVLQDVLTYCDLQQISCNCSQNHNVPDRAASSRGFCILGSVVIKSTF